MSFIARQISSKYMKREWCRTRAFSSLSFTSFILLSPGFSKMHNFELVVVVLQAPLPPDSPPPSRIIAAAFQGRMRS
jgi:hypothetical protein